MREIKFRAWDKEKTQIVDVICLALDYSTVFKIGDNEEYGINTSDLEPMQFTGLKDKNGKEIYEGDIVKYNFGDYLWEVKWAKRNAGFEYYEIKKKNTFLNKEQKVNLSKYGITNRMGNCEVEIIGNIYENPELLRLIN